MLLFVRGAAMTKPPSGQQVPSEEPSCGAPDGTSGQPPLTEAGNELPPPQPVQVQVPDLGALPTDLETTSAHSAQTALPVIAGYDILHELGAGGMGVVYKARQRSLDRIVALKMILPGRHLSTASLARFRREAVALGRLKHPNIIEV